MTNHLELQMHKEEVRIVEKAILQAIIEGNETCNVAFHDEPFPYVVPMNYGYEWNDSLVFYMHMAVEGHRIELIKKDPRVAVCVWSFLDRVGFASYRKETHDYRSVMAYGIAQIITPEEEEEFLHGMTVLCQHTGRKAVKKITGAMRKGLFVMKITCDIVTGKAQYPIHNVEEAAMPENKPRNSLIVN